MRYEVDVEAGLAGAGTGKGAKRACGRLEAVFGGEMATAKIQTVKGLRVEIFSRSLRKNTTRPLTVWIVGTDVERGIAFRNWVCYNFPQYKPINWDL